ncbi:MAG TPA: N-acetyltransferase [Rhabdochlamydiaceae bacterium]|nr:N-acetyltransferase [Rhabdochlamydiaceae bacterium]
MAIQAIPKEQPLKPIEIKNDHFPRFRKVTTLFFVTIAIAPFGAAAGIAAAALIEAKITFVVAAAVGGVIGLATALVIAFLLHKKELSPLQQYRLATLEQIERDQPKLAELVLQAKKVFLQVSDEKLRFYWAAEHHALHDLITKITLSAPMKDRKGLKEVWEKFLKNSNGIELSYPQGPKHQLDFSMELERLDGKEIAFRTVWLNPRFSSFEKVLQEITALELETDGWASNVDPNRYDIGLRERFSKKDSPDRCILVRRKVTNELLGMLWYEFKPNNKKSQHIPKESIHICYVARKSNAAQLHIGRALLNEFFSKVSIALSAIDLKVRAHNEPAKKLYENFGFVVEGTDPNYYSFPREDALVMRFNYEQYIAKHSQRIAI